MKKTERFQNIKLDIQTDDFDPSKDIITTIHIELRKLMRVYGSILGADVYLCYDSPTDADRKVARMRVGAPGRNYVAEACSDTWDQALLEVTGKLRSQLLGRHTANHRAHAA
ncbi:HPF/RaiA family ribosome-associated protein [Persicitalea jodogahamensis]|uniref:Uncharacterized protein n=1 Tax=Persicitalea jodogahamensis TaxID=402147 RepID=A0A8J3DC37_9BACT|nr:HPF/RaiA family ribosome-associated protein [Persicitalea jodogahamensis]GHB80889.1 hypothetical protein GCM10007390_39380 [Persicitalea jodogahamensis]